MSGDGGSDLIAVAVRDSAGRPCPIALEVRTQGPALPLPRPRYSVPGPEALARADETVYVTGGEFTPEMIVAGYRLGYFPWPRDEEDELWWCSPNPRAILPVETFTVPRRLGRTIRSGRFRVTVDAAFDEVIAACGERREGTWLTPNLAAAYRELHALGWAHSFEVWLGETLAGGLYGLAVGAMFGAESMFTLYTDASKVAAAAMVQHCRAIGVELVDIQVLNPHTARMGGVDVPRREYLARLERALRREARWFDGGSAGLPDAAQGHG
ncbi:MAG: leucyl/phenylalanyl-tRNA--protein transferase [Tepidiforma sp.]|uniref:leucyl/phenylalanyl-tRNA--protein transferase n=1 Tax=Tepidiforma sp. TaxID=2682230 RepID=UPI0026355FED|nr:leucyl/phenylalanyl-tRNA--protein transferase [Tepidiforma sp.]MCX7617722.1 leucyl/phenylalanyl-tRNA--protein transferase [Tepidiforma sp.]